MLFHVKNLLSMTKSAHEKRYANQNVDVIYDRKYTNSASNVVNKKKIPRGMCTNKVFARVIFFCSLILLSVSVLRLYHAFSY